jgi:asparagine synthetase B (glutamine-hydrolysing)
LEIRAGKKIPKGKRQNKGKDKNKFPEGSAGGGENDGTEGDVGKQCVSVPVATTARVLLLGMGADEQLAGYGRHRTRFAQEGWAGLITEVAMDVSRISDRNLGRDDRCVSDHGREARFPFLDEEVVTFLNGLPMDAKVDFQLPRGLGEKLILRDVARLLGLGGSAAEPKRAIQFGSRIAKIEEGSNKSHKKGSEKF